MPWTEVSGNPLRPVSPSRSRSPGILLLVVAAAILLGALAVAAQEKHLSVYAPQTYYQVAVINRAGAEYVGLLDVLEPLGKIESRSDGKTWKLRFTPGQTPMDSAFESGKRLGTVRGAQVHLGGEFFVEADRGYVPLASLPNLLPRLLDRTIDLHLAGRRLFLSGAGLKYSAEIRSNPGRLVISFPSAVTPSVASAGNHVRLTFLNQPVISSGPDNNSYNEPPIVSASFSEANGSAVLDISGSGPLQAVRSEGGRVYTISSAASVSQSASPISTPAAAVEVPLPPPNISGAQPAPVRNTGSHRSNLVIIDAAHGGEERGAQLTDKLNEKDVTLALARRIQHELENRGFSAILIRTGDADLPMDQRAASANASRAAIYLGVHAATLGIGVRIYTALLAPAPKSDRRKFVPWESAQAPFLQDSVSVASTLASECTSRGIPARAVSAPLRPLNNVAGIAISLELAPASDTVESINDAKYQQNVAVSIATAIAAARGKLEPQ